MGKVTPEKRRLLVRLLLTVCWMCVIFWFSSRNESESVGFSGRLLEKIVDMIPFRRYVSAVAKKVMKSRLHYAFRKLAHFTEFAVLGSLLTLTAHKFFPRESYSRRVRVFLRAFLPVLLSFIYAGSDEIHQLFSDGRNSNLRDVLIDTSGACFGVLITALLSALYHNLKRKRAHTASE